MKVLLSWLQEFAPITGDPVDLGEELSDLGLAVEEMEILGEGLDGIVVAKVLELSPHPDADRIQLVQVDRGDGEALQVCCGAFNMSVGDLVPLATVGTTMPNGMDIAARKMRGEMSNGMLCSAAELGLGSDHGGIMILPDHPLGTPLTEALGLDGDVLWDLEVNPNRPDALSVVGVARDLAARLRVPFTPPSPVVSEAGDDATGRISVEILDPVLCGRFVARVFDDVRIGPSSTKIANRLRALGMRPINNVVDVSNYVMLELGQPSHAFDLATVTGGALRVRRAREGETLVTLDDVTRELHPSDGVICDADDAVISLAGVMGGASTEISDTTSSAIVEMAWWDPPSIAHTSRRHALRSEASGRFERTIDPQIADLAMARFAELMAGGAQLASGVVDERGQLPEPARVRLRTSRLNEILGAEITPEMVDGYLEPIGFEVTPVGEDRDVAVPSFRPDTTTEIDVIEEVARHHGYSKIAKTVPTSARAGALTAAQQDRRRVRALMIGRGVTEAMPLPFLAPGDLAKAGLDEAGIVVTNPLVSEESVMRSSLRPGLLKAVAYNASHRNHAVSLYELGTTFGAVPAGAALPDEREVLGVVLAGREAPAAAEIWWDLVEHLLVEDASLENASVPGLHATRAARLNAAGTEVGVAGEIAPDVLEAFEITGRVAWIEVDLTVLFGLPHGEHQLEPFSRYPSSDIDLAFVVGDDVPAAALRSALRDAAGELLAGLELFDVHRSERLGEGLRSLAFRMRFQADDRTLTDDEVAAVRDRCIAAGEAVGARLRD